jgi:dihydroorotate dehydrogenase (fumarate)
MPMDLSTTYLGFKLPHPITPGAGPLADDLDSVKRLQDAGAPLIMLRSLFEEQIVGEQLAYARALDMPSESFAEATRFLPDMQDFVLGPDEYLEHVRRVKKATQLPVVASLNGTTLGGWLDFAPKIVDAGADALELNLYDLPTDPGRTAHEIENELVDVVLEVRRLVKKPIAVKLSPFYTSLPNIARQLVGAGADALVLFNRFYQPDIDPEQLEIKPALRLSSSGELNLRLRWIALLYGRIEAELALTGGVHRGIDAVKALQCGANCVQVVSALLMHGPGHLKTIVDELNQWMEENEYAELTPMIGNMSHRRCPDPRQLERANYARILQSWSRD